MSRTLWGGIAAVALLGAGLVAAPATSVVASGANDRRCAPSDTSSARVAKGGRINAEPTRMTASQHRASERQTVQRLVQRYGGKAAAPRAKRVVIDTHVFVITRRNGSGNTSTRTVNKQMRAINRAFAGDTAKRSVNTPFRFRMRSLQRVNNTDWYNWKYGDDERPAKKRLHRGGSDDLNVYITNLGDALLGYAYYPYDRLLRKSPFLDGLVIHKASTPGGAFEAYDKGDTATHEIGHWLGLAHTFEGSCSPNGDFVTDTPRQKADERVFKCKESLNTCGKNPGPNPLTDPVHNFMNYTSDRCIDRFTRGQKDRMWLHWLAYRKGG